MNEIFFVDEQHELNFKRGLYISQGIFTATVFYD
jgi:hypothetical protein